jgi:hypothetical protein
MMRLGKREHVFDERTVPMGLMLRVPPAISIPPTWDFDRKRRAFPVSSWGNDQWGNCVIAGRGNHQLRMERIEHRRTIPLTVDDVVTEYKSEVLRQFGVATSSPGDAGDNGLYVLNSLGDWRNEGWNLRIRPNGKIHKLSIAAYGELEPNDREMLRAASFLLAGIQMGLWLPETARRQFSQGQAWDVQPGNAPETQPGTWGGHLVYVKRYDSGGMYCLTWGREHYMTNAFIEKYCDEAWAAVDDLQSNSKWLDVTKLKQHLIDVGARNIG